MRIRIEDIKVITQSIVIDGTPTVYTLVSFALSDLTERLKEMGYEKRMFGTLPSSDFIDGSLAKQKCLADFCCGITVGDALAHREFMISHKESLLRIKGMI